MDAVVMYAATTDPAHWVPAPGSLPEPQEMRRIALESTLIEDLLQRVTALEKRVLELENG